MLDRSRLVYASLLHALVGGALTCMTSCSPAGPEPAREVRPANEGRPREHTSANSAPRESLSPAVRRLLSARMQRHRAQMNALLNAAIVLDWTGVEQASARLLEEPAFAPPLPGEDDSLNKQLPASFFIHQQRLLATVGELRTAAARESDHEVKVAFNGVTDACFQCHAAYLEGTRQPRLFEPARSPAGPSGADLEPE